MEDDELIKRLSEHPKLKARFTRYLDIIENTKGDVGLADLAEESIILGKAVELAFNCFS